MTDSEALKIAMRALAWYADEAHWNRDDWGVMGVVASPDYADAGGKARRALKRIRSAGDGMSPTPDLPTKPHEPRLHRTLTIFVCTVKDCPSFFGVDDPDSPDGDHGWDPDGWPHCPTHKRPMRPTRVEEVRERPGDHPAGCFYGSFAEAYPDAWHVPAGVECRLDHGAKPIQLGGKAA